MFVRKITEISRQKGYKYKAWMEAGMLAVN
jgi:hypothetical protein